MTVSVADSRGRRGQLCVLSRWSVAGLAVIQVKESRKRQDEVRVRDRYGKVGQGKLRLNNVGKDEI